MTSREEGNPQRLGAVEDDGGAQHKLTPAKLVVEDGIDAT